MSDTATALRLPLVEGDRQPADVTNDICRPMENSPSGLWWFGIALSSAALALGVARNGPRRTSTSAPARAAVTVVASAASASAARRHSRLWSRRTAPRVVSVLEARATAASYAGRTGSSHFPPRLPPGAGRGRHAARPVRA